MLNAIAWKWVVVATSTIVLPYTAVFSQKPAADSLMILFTQIASEGKPEDKPRLLDIMKALANRGDEKGMETASSAAYFLGEYTMSDSIFKAAAKKFPTGSAARTVAYVTMFKENTSGKKLEQAYGSWRTQYPDTSVRNDLYEDGKKKIALLYAGEKDYTNARRWAVKQNDAWKRVQQDMEIGKIAFDKGDTAIGLEWQGAAMNKLATLPVKNWQDSTRSVSFYMNTPICYFKLVEMKRHCVISTKPGTVIRHNIRLS